MATTAKQNTENLQACVRDIRTAVQSGTNQQTVAENVASTLAEHLSTSNLLTAAQQQPDPERYRQHVLHVELDGSFSVVALVWLPGQSTPIHDHVTWCVVGVYKGNEHEVRFRLEHGTDVDYLVEVEQATNHEGSVAALPPPGDIHLVRNNGDDLAISIHVYGADIGELGTSVRRTYTHDIRTGS